MKDLHKDKRSLNTALNTAKRYVNGCENAERYIIKKDGKYLVIKKSDEYILKVEFKEGKLNVVDPKKETREESKKAKKADKKVLSKLPENPNVETA